MASYGTCKYASSGCTFSHDVAGVQAALHAHVTAASSSSSAPSSSAPPPSTSPSAAMNANAAPFSVGASSSSSSSISLEQAAKSAREFVPTGSMGSVGVGTPLASPSPPAGVVHTMGGKSYFVVGEGPPDELVIGLGNPDDEAGESGQGKGGKVQKGPRYVPIPMHYFAAPLPHAGAPELAQKELLEAFTSPVLRARLAKNNALLLAHTDAEDGSVPSRVGRYHTLFPLDDAGMRESVSEVFRMRTSVYKGISGDDGAAYALRRVDGFRLTHENAISLVDMWRSVSHSNIVSLREAWTSKDFGERAMVFVYDYYPDAKSLTQIYFRGPLSALIPEPRLWSYTVQLITALAAIHNSSLAVRSLAPSKILVTPTGRLLINCVGMMDILNADTLPALPLAIVEDVYALGKILLGLSAAPLGPADPAAALSFVESRYSPEWTNLLRLLAAGPRNGKYPSATELASMITPHVLIELDRAQKEADILEGELAKELENGRLFVLAAKLGMINERPPEDMPDPNWGETDNRYLLSLFRDYVFHQVDNSGAPVLDLGHIVEALNKLDIGSDEQIMLLSRNQQSVIVLSYADIKGFVSSALDDLARPR